MSTDVFKSTFLTSITFELFKKLLRLLAEPTSALDSTHSSTLHCLISFCKEAFHFVRCCITLAHCLASSFRKVMYSIQSLSLLIFTVTVLAGNNWAPFCRLSMYAWRLWTSRKQSSQFAVEFVWRRYFTALFVSSLATFSSFSPSYTRRIFCAFGWIKVFQTKSWSKNCTVIIFLYIVSSKVHICKVVIYGCSHCILYFLMCAYS